MKALKFLAVLGLILSGSLAQASLEQPLWDCALTFKAKGGGLQVIVGKFQLRGKGNLRCVDIAGNTQVLPVKVTLGGEPINASIGLGYLRVNGVATGIGIVTEPKEIFGRYRALGGQASVIVGAGANLALHGSDNSLTINAALSVARGVGASVGLTTMKIEPRE